MGAVTVVVIYLAFSVYKVFKAHNAVWRQRKILYGAKACVKYGNAYISAVNSVRRTAAYGFGGNIHLKTPLKNVFIYFMDI